MKHGYKIDERFYAALTDLVRQQYSREYATQYRQSDDRGLNSVMHTDLCEVLGDLSRSFGYAISALDLGCGTGRYFHCLTNLKRLTGVDASQNMLAMARRPVRGPNISVPVDLICADITDVAFAPHSFDLIYCIGVLGLHLPLEPFLLAHIRPMLKAGGKFVFTAVDRQSPQATSWKRIVATACRPLLPQIIKRKVDCRLRTFSLTEDELRSIMAQSHFNDYKLNRRYSPSGRIDFVCIATMP